MHPGCTLTGPRLLLARHGRTEWNRLGLLQGTADVPLDAVGRRQADDLARTLAARPLARVYSSPLLRARETAERILAARGSSVELVVLDDLRELSYGLWQGKTPRQRALADPYLERCWRIEPWLARFPGGETLAQLMRRADQVICRVRQERDGDVDAPALVVAHGHIIRALLLRLRRRPVEDFWRIEVPNAALLGYSTFEGGVVLSRLYGDSVHVDRAAAHLGAWVAAHRV